jgi:threonine dehydrogenase-like Zn-dependent dehydrogenase
MTTGTISTVMHVPRFLGQGIIDFVETPIPEPGPGYLLIQIKANALCGSERGPR